MVVWFLLAALLAIIGLRFRGSSFNDDFLSLSQCQAVNGLAILVVFARHIVHLGVMKLGYNMSGLGDASYFDVSTVVQQLLVVPFMFYSGYGVMEQYKRKGESYVAAIPKRRLWCTWANFAIAVGCFAAVNLGFNTGVSIKQILLAFTCFDQIGNPSWYILAILWCYASTWVGIRLALKLGLDGKRSWWLVLAGLLLYCVILHIVYPQQLWWYDTIIAYAFGSFVSVHGQRMFEFVKRHYWVCMLVVGIVFATLYFIGYDIYDMRQYKKLLALDRWSCVLYAVRHNVLSCLFMMLVMMLLMKVKLGNAVLAWCGQHVFPIYIYHLLFFLVAKCLIPAPISTVTAHALVVAALALTLLTARFYHYWEVKC